MQQWTTARQMTAPEAASIKPMRDCGRNARDPDAGREIKWRYAYGSRYQVIREFVGGAAFNSWCGFECRNLAVAKRARRADSALKSWGILSLRGGVSPLPPSSATLVRMSRGRRAGRLAREDDLVAGGLARWPDVGEQRRQP